jgi:gamma-glutamyl phosphate reductase
MTRPLITIHNTETDEIITREMNDKELAQHEADLLVENTRIAEAAAKATARQEILDRLGLSAEEAALLLG